MHFCPLQLLLLLFSICSHLPKPSAEPGAKVWAQGCTSGLFSAVQSGAIVYSTCWHVLEWHLPFSNNITLSIHARSPLFPGAQTGLCSSPVHLPSLAFFWAPEFSFLHAALSLSFTLLILDPFYFVLSELLWIPVLSLKVFLRPLLPHAVGNLSEAKIYHIHSIPLPTSPETLPEKEIHLVWHNLLFTNPHWMVFFPFMLSQSLTDCQ